MAGEMKSYRAEYTCGSQVGFECDDAEVAAVRVAEIEASECPMCKMRKGQSLTDLEVEIVIKEAVIDILADIFTYRQATKN